MIAMAFLYNTIRVSPALRLLHLNGTRVCLRPTIGAATITASGSIYQAGRLGLPNIQVSAIHQYSEKAPAAILPWAQLDKAFSRFETLSQSVERVTEKNYVKTFDALTKAVEKLEATGSYSNLSVYTAILLRCCGSLMLETPEKTREMLAANLWEFIKAKNIPVDISHYNALLRALNENKTNYDPQKFLDEIEQASLMPDRVTYQRLIHQYCVQGDVAGATKILEKMKSLNMELNELTFASLIIGYSKQETPASIDEMFDLMKSNGIEPGGKSYRAAIVSQVQLLTKNPSVSQELEKLLKKMEVEDIQFGSSETVELLSELKGVKKDDLTSKIIEHVCKKTSLRSLNDNYRVTYALFQLGYYEEASKLYWSQKHSDNALRYGNLGTYYIKIMTSHKNVPDDFCLAECKKLKESRHNKRTYLHLYYNAALNGNLNLVRAALDKLKEEEEEPPKCQFYWPLLAQTDDKDAIVRVLKDDIKGQTMRTDDIMDTFALWVWPKFSNNIFELFEINNSQLNFDNNILIASFIQYSIIENKIPEAIKFISEAPSNFLNFGGPTPTLEPALDSEEVIEEDRQEGTSRRRNDRPTGPAAQRTRLVGRLLDQIAEETKDPEMVTKAYNMCKGNGNQPMTSKSLNALVSVHLLNQDYKKAIEVFLSICEEHGCTPSKKDLIIYCLENKDPDNLQRIMNASSGIHGEMNSLFDLAVCCLECNKLKQAQKIFASPGFRVNSMRIYETSRVLANRGNIDVLENFVHLTRGMADVDQEQLYNILINACDRASNPKRVLDLWNRMQEEDFYPGKRSLLMIANVLEKHNMEVPFQKPSQGSARLIR